MRHQDMNRPQAAIRRWGREGDSPGGRIEANRSGKSSTLQPQFLGREAFAVWAVSAGFAVPERLVEMILADLGGAS